MHSLVSTLQLLLEPKYADGEKEMFILVPQFVMAAYCTRKIQLHETDCMKVIILAAQLNVSPSSY